jgi:hypothetical protein
LVLFFADTVDASALADAVGFEPAALNLVPHGLAGDLQAAGDFGDGQAGGAH